MVPYFQEVRQVVQIDGRPEGRHDVLRQNSPGLLAADALFKQGLVFLQALLIGGSDHFPRFILSFRRHGVKGSLAVVLALRPDHGRHVELDVGLRVAAADLVVGPGAVAVPLASNEERTVDDEGEDHVLKRARVAVLQEVLHQDDVALRDLGDEFPE